MRRILRSVVMLAVCALACAAMTALVAPHAPATPAAANQNPFTPDSSAIPPDQRDLPDEPLGPGPEVGNEPSQPPPAEQPPAQQPPAEQPGAAQQNAGARADSTHAGAAADSAHAGALADSSEFIPSAVVKPAAEAPFDTLALPSTTPPPTNSTAGPAVGAAKKPTMPADAPPKPRTGVLGIHPAAILIGLAALNYFIIKWATD